MTEAKCSCIKITLLVNSETTGIAWNSRDIFAFHMAIELFYNDFYLNNFAHYMLLIPFILTILDRCGMEWGVTSVVKCGETMQECLSLVIRGFMCNICCVFVILSF